MLSKAADIQEGIVILRRSTVIASQNIFVETSRLVSDQQIIPSPSNSFKFRSKLDFYFALTYDGCGADSASDVFVGHQRNIIVCCVVNKSHVRPR